MDIDGPIFLFLERADFALALNHHPKGDRLHPARGQSPAHFVPQQRRNLVSHQPVENASGLLRFNAVQIHLPRFLEGFLDSAGGDFVKHHPEKLGSGFFGLLAALSVLRVVAQFFLEVIADGLAFTVRVSR